MTPESFRAIAAKFAIRGRVLTVQPLGSGLINDTFKVETDGPDDYVLQRINHAIFQDVPLLQHNIEAVTRHIREKLAGDLDIDRKVLRFIPLSDSPQTYFQASDGTFWRMSVLIRDAYTHEAVTLESAYDAGKAFGRFEAMLADLEEPLGETIPDFHNMELRARQLREAVAADKAGRMSDPAVRDLVEEAFSYEWEMCKAERMHREGLLPKRICHCDTKVNNMLFDADGNVLCVIDLDTVMPSFVFSDFGDFMRTAANTGAEDDRDLGNVHFSLSIFKAFSKGYIESASVFLTPVERENLPFAAMLFPYMQTVRFLADYINGDTYYRIQYPGHNWIRSLAQWKLFTSVRASVPAMKEWLDSL